MLQVFCCHCEHILGACTEWNEVLSVNSAKNSGTYRHPEGAKRLKDLVNYHGILRLRSGRHSVSDCFVAAFYFHFLRTALEIIHLAMNYHGILRLRSGQHSVSDCFVAAFYFHFLRTALEIIHLAMTARVFFKFKYTPQLAVVSFIRVIPDSDLLYSIIVIPTYVYI